jgi:hypothetical protein
VSYAADSSSALCAASGYDLAGDTGRRWARGAPGDTGYAWLSITVLDTADAADEWGQPSAPGSFQRADPPGTLHALRAESVSVHREVIQTAIVEVETARVSGGVTGLNRHPVLRAVWRVGDGRWVLAQGFATEPATLDTLRAMLRTVRVVDGT